MGERDFSGSTTAGGVARLTDLDAYYRGTQRLAFLHPEHYKVKSFITPLRLNWPRLVVDSIAQRLHVEGFLLGGDEADANLWRIWQANRLDMGSRQVHTDALVHGRSFVMVWPNARSPKTPRITVESAHQITVKLDPETGEVVEAVKEWLDDDVKHRVILTKSGIVKHEGDGEPVRAMPNPFGVVPVVAFVNRPSVMYPLGESEMTDVLPLTDAASKLATDMMISAEHHAMPRRWATGVEMGGEEGDERARDLVRRRWQEATAGAVWLSDSNETKFGQFTEASLENFIAGVNMLASQASALTGLPPHYFGIHSENPTSADAIRSAEASLVMKVRDRQASFAEAWEDVLRMALLMSGDGTGPAVVPESAALMETIWRDPNTPTIAQTMDAVVKGVQAGVLDTVAGQEIVGLSPAQRKAIADRQSDAPEMPAAPVAPPSALDGAV